MSDNQNQEARIVELEGRVEDLTQIAVGLTNALIALAQGKSLANFVPQLQMQPLLSRAQRRAMEADLRRAEQSADRWNNEANQADLTLEANNRLMRLQHRGGK